jgi:hypothetical protein
MPSHCNSYGFSGGFAAVCAAIAWYLVQDRSCKINIANMFSDQFNSDNLQMFHYVAIIVGAILFVLSFFDFASVLYEVRLLFLFAILGILASGGAMLYATYVAFHVSCKSAFNNILDTVSGDKNVIEAQDEVGISIMVLDLIAALLLISAAISFSRTY